jgi:hypothetical protein
MPQEVIQEKLETLEICVQGFLQHRSGRHYQEASTYPHLILNFIMSVAPGLEVGIYILTEICGLRELVEM